MKKGIIAIAIMAMLTTGCKHKPEMQSSTTQIEKTTISNTITATGTIEPVTSVDVGTQVSGIVSKLYVDYNSTVKAGQVIAELDRTNLMSELSSAQANLKSAQSELNYQKTNHERYKNLYDKGLISANDYDQAHLAYIKAQQSVTQLTENVRRAQTNLSYATITSPIDGVVLSKEVEEGQTVASSFNTPTLFKIAKDLTDMRVIADVDEADIGGVKEGQRVTFSVDAYPDDIFNGTVTQVRQQATTTSNVVTYQVVISAPNQDLKLKPGLTANVTIYIMEISDVLAISNRALNFRPDETMLNEGETISDIESSTKLWIKEGNSYKAIPVTTGVTDGTKTQILTGVSEGMEIVSDIQIVGVEEEMNPANNNPFMPKFHKDKNKDKKK